MDVLNVTVLSSSGTYLGSILTRSNLNAGGYFQATSDLTQFKGQTVRIQFLASSNGTLPTVFRIDDISLVQQ